MHDRDDDDPAPRVPAHRPDPRLAGTEPDLSDPDPLDPELGAEPELDPEAYDPHDPYDPYDPHPDEPNTGPQGPGRQMRLAKLLAQRGIASRREAEKLVADGQVTVNGAVVSGVVLVDPDRDHVRVSGRPLPPEPAKVYFVLYKPKGCITTRSDPDGRPTVFDHLGALADVVEPVGRLDFDTEGALLLTNDGDLANALTHPKNQIPKRYLAKVYRQPDERDLNAIRTGVFLDDGRTAPAKARLLETTDKSNAWLEVTVTEGRNRLVRRMMQALGHPVSKLRRESFATISVRGMLRGQVRPLSGEEIRRLRDLAAGVRPDRAGKKRGKGFAKPKPKPTRPNRGGNRAGKRRKAPSDG